MFLFVVESKTYFIVAKRKPKKKKKTKEVADTEVLGGAGIFSYTNHRLVLQSFHLCTLVADAFENMYL